MKYLGKGIAFTLLQQKLIRMWNLRGNFELLDLGVNFYIARFELAKECMHALVGGPWKIFYNYLVPQRWKPNFDPEMEKLEKMAVCVRLPWLPVEYFKEEIIKLILDK